jgi:hypothetical protein
MARLYTGVRREQATKPCERAASGKVVGVIERLQRLMADLEMLIRPAKTEDGKVRNAKLLGTSFNQMRRCLEIGVKLHQAMPAADEVDRLQNVVLDEIWKCDEERHVSVVLRLNPGGAGASQHRHYRSKAGALRRSSGGLPFSSS